MLHLILLHNFRPKSVGDKLQVRGGRTVAVSGSTQRSGVLVLSLAKHKTLAQRVWNLLCTLALSDGAAAWAEVDKSA